MPPFFRLIRLPNLLIVAFTQGLIYYVVLLPTFKYAGLTPEMGPLSFWMLCLATLLVTAAGYVVNEVHDQPGDVVNKPDRRVVGVHFSEKFSLRLYIFLGISGFLVSAILAFTLQKFSWLPLYPFAFGTLYCYTVFAQHRVLLGNLLIAAFCAGVAGLIWVAEIRTLRELSAVFPEQYLRVRAIFIWYGIFAFLVNLYRELVKDLEDLPGDKAVGSRSLPVVAGITNAVRIAQVLALGLIVFLAMQARPLFLLFGFPLPVFLGIGVVLPLVFTVFKLQKAACPQEFRIVSHWIKLVIVFGVLSLFFVSVG